jgi:hypothetical protein
VVLPDALAETSGAAVSRRDPTAIWTHNDEGSSLYAIDERGRILSEHRLALELRDWEDIAVTDCQGGSCLYLADTGDNSERRRGGDIRIVRLREPDPRTRASSGSTPVDADVFPIALPDGARDVEALFVLPGERVYLVSKGRQHPPTLYRYPGPLRGDTVMLDEVQRLGSGPRSLLAQVTGASVSADGMVVAGLVDLRTLEEIQGEAVALGPGGLVVLTSEGGPLGGPASMRLLTCRLDAA